MVHCTECNTALADPSDVEFVEMDADLSDLGDHELFYVAACSGCGAAIGSGVAGVRA